jgi:hypothetical protein
VRNPQLALSPKDAAAKTKQSVRTIAEDVQIAKSIPEAVRDAIRDTPVADNEKGDTRKHRPFTF